MPLPIVIAHHILSTGYGWWLPNDLRGSCSTCIADDVIAELGELHYGRKRVQPASRDVRAFYTEARKVLRFPLVTFDRSDFEILARAFSDVIARERYTCYAAVFMPDHWHAAIRKHKHSAEEMIRNFQGGSRDAFRVAGRCAPDHPVWGQSGWKVFLDHPDDIRRTIKYIDDNPVKWRLPRQQWDFVTPYDGWPLHPGHSPNSPYARRLRENDGRR